MSAALSSDRWPALPAARTAAADARPAATRVSLLGVGIALAKARGMDREPELTAAFRHLLSDFRRSTEYARAASPGNARWVESLLDVLATCDWALDDLDPYALDAALGEGMGWTIDRAPDDPAAVARELLAFLLWARRVGAAHAHLDYQRCCAYLASAAAPRDIAARLRPIEIRFHDASWRRQVW